MTQAPVAVRPPAHRFSVDEYYAMAEAGILGEDDRVELLEGEVVQMTPIGSMHSGTVERIVEQLRLAVGADVGVRTQNPIRLTNESEPQPDVSVVRRRDDFYTTSHPGPADVLLLVEVMQSSAEYDRAVKVPLYARAGIPEVWLVDIEAGLIERYRSPAEGAYRDQSTHTSGETIRAGEVPGVELQVEDALG